MTPTIKMSFANFEELRRFQDHDGARKLADLVEAVKEPAIVEAPDWAAMKTSWAGDTFAPSAPPPGDVTEAGPSLKVPGGQDYNYYYKYPTDPFSNPFQGQLTHTLMDGIVPPDNPQDVMIGNISYNERTFYQLVGVLSLEERVEIVTANWQDIRLSVGEVLYCPLGMCDLAAEYFEGHKSEKALPSASTLTSALLLSGRIKPHALEAIYGNTLWFMQNWDAQRIKKRDLADLFQVDYREEGRWHDTAGW